jgi:hypothetical protein
MNGDLDLTNATDTTPKEAPVSEPEPLTGKEKAGVYLTWGILGVLIGFLLIIIGVFVWGELEFFRTTSALHSLEKGASAESLEKVDSLLSSVASQRTAFRTFWFDTLQLILLNVLFPTLTALLGYIFGTSRNNN